jgi:hypothetical protein
LYGLHTYIHTYIEALSTASKLSNCYYLQCTYVCMYVTLHVLRKVQFVSAVPYWRCCYCCCYYCCCYCCCCRWKCWRCWWLSETIHYKFINPIPPHYVNINCNINFVVNYITSIFTVVSKWWVGTCNSIEPEPISRLLNLQLQRQRCSRLERFYIGEKIIFILQTRLAFSCIVNFYNAGVVTRSRRIGSWFQEIKIWSKLRK